VVVPDVSSLDREITTADNAMMITTATASAIPNHGVRRFWPGWYPG
jgi:hypothetical protein